MKKTIIILGVVIIVLLGILVFYNPAQTPGTVPYPTSTTGGGTPAPQPMVSADGHVVVAAPLAGGTISSPVTVMGSVTGGGWFFEASFPVKVLDSTGKVIGQGTAQASGEPGSWMSTGTVPFVAKITFTAPKTAAGTVLLSKDNPSGDPKNDMQLSVPIIFSTVEGTNANTGINGTVLLSPSCPVETNPPAPGCSPKPYQTNIVISLKASPTVTYRTVASDANGKFSAALPAGSYVFTAQGGNPYPRCSSNSATVTAGSFQTIELSCDTGIR